MEVLSDFLFYLISFVIILSIIVGSHEFGHYIVAKLSGVKIEVFSIGFGKEICGFNDKSGTRWKLCWIPFGGYVKMFGDINPASVPDKDVLNKMTEEEKKVAFHTKPLSIKALVVAAGPLANFIFAIILLTGFFYANGKPIVEPIVKEVVEDGSAFKAGIIAGDKIIEIDNEEINSFDDIQRVVGINTGTELNFKIDRAGQELEILVTPEIVQSQDLFGNEIKRPLIGIRSGIISHNELGIFQAFIESIHESYNIGESTLKALGQMVTGERSIREITGPVGIAKYSGQSVKMGIETVIWFMVIISINLGLVNLFPIPALDGGHLMYYAVEKIQGKPLADKFQVYGFYLGVFLVLSLAIFAVINDIVKLFG